jgi:hypothetical protein
MRGSVRRRACVAMDDRVHDAYHGQHPVDILKSDFSF